MAFDGFNDARQLLAIMAQQARETQEPRAEQHAEQCQVLQRVAMQNMVAVKVHLSSFGSRGGKELQCLTRHPHI